MVRTRREPVDIIDADRPAGVAEPVREHVVHGIGDFPDRAQHVKPLRKYLAVAQECRIERLCNADCESLPAAREGRAVLGLGDQVEVVVDCQVDSVIGLRPRPTGGDAGPLWVHAGTIGCGPRGPVPAGAEAGGRSELIQRGSACLWRRVALRRMSLWRHSDISRPVAVPGSLPPGGIAPPGPRSPLAMRPEGPA